MVTWQAEWGVDPATPVIRLQRELLDEWFQHLATALREKFDIGLSTGNSRHINGQLLYEWIANTPDGRELPRLYAVAGLTEMRLELCGRGEQRASDVDCWNQVIVAASEMMGARRNLVQWEAVVAQHRSMREYSGRRLLEARSFGDLEVVPMEACVLDYVTEPFGTDIGVFQVPFGHWPLKVRGVVDTYDWTHHGVGIAAREVRKVAALLSLDWETAWSVRQGPHERDIRMGGDSQALYSENWDVVPPGSFLGNGKHVGVASWFESALARIASSRRLMQAVLMHHEGLVLSRDHPSIALVCFVASIEAAAQISRKPSRCPECKSVTGSADRFRVAIDGRVSPALQPYLEKAYGQRSSTVHQGMLHGLELDLNAWGNGGVFASVTGLDFVAGTVEAGREASKGALLKYLAE